MNDTQREFVAHCVSAYMLGWAMYFENMNTLLRSPRPEPVKRSRTHLRLIRGGL